MWWSCHVRLRVCACAIAHFLCVFEERGWAGIPFPARAPRSTGDPVLCADFSVRRPACGAVDAETMADSGPASATGMLPQQRAAQPPATATNVATGTGAARGLTVPMDSSPGALFGAFQHRAGTERWEPLPERNAEGLLRGTKFIGSSLSSSARVDVPFPELPSDADTEMPSWRTGLHSDWRLRLGGVVYSIHKVALPASAFLAQQQFPVSRARVWGCE